MVRNTESNVYLDHNATSPLLPVAEKRMFAVFAMHLGNPSSPHWTGREARHQLEDSRLRIAGILGAKAGELIFTSGGSEGNNTVLRQMLLSPGPKHLITSATEHPSVLETSRLLATVPDLGLTILPVDASGRVAPESLMQAIRPETTLVSVMSANNETGALQPMEELLEICRQHEVRFHSDCVQCAGKVEMNLTDSGFDYATFSAHKMGGPKGAGLLYVREGIEYQPLISGGSQERARRAGTESVALACAFAEAMEWYDAHRRNLNARFMEFRKQILNELKGIEGMFLNTPPDVSLPHTLNLGFKGVSAESLLISLDLDGIAVSTGSACSSGAMEASHVLQAMGVSYDDAKASLRVSMGWDTTSEGIRYFIERLFHHVGRLRNKTGSRHVKQEAPAC